MTTFEPLERHQFSIRSRLRLVASGEGRVRVREGTDDQTPAMTKPDKPPDTRRDKATRSLSSSSHSDSYPTPLHAILQRPRHRLYSHTCLNMAGAGKTSSVRVGVTSGGKSVTNGKKKKERSECEHSVTRTTTRRSVNLTARCIVLNVRPCWTCRACDLPNTRARLN